MTIHMTPDFVHGRPAAAPEPPAGALLVPATALHAAYLCVRCASSGEPGTASCTSSQKSWFGHSCLNLKNRNVHSLNAMKAAKLPNRWLLKFWICSQQRSTVRAAATVTAQADRCCTHLVHRVLSDRELSARAAQVNHRHCAEAGIHAVFGHAVDELQQLPPLDDCAGRGDVVESELARRDECQQRKI